MSLMSSALEDGFFTASASWESLFIPGKRERRSFEGLGYLLEIHFLRADICESNSQCQLPMFVPALNPRNLEY